MTWAAFVRKAYQAARDWGMQPSEFWRLSPWEWWAELDAKIEAQERIDEALNEAKGGKAKGGGFSRAEWDKARAKHSEKMKAMQ